MGTVGDIAQLGWLRAALAEAPVRRVARSARNARPEVRLGPAVAATEAGPVARRAPCDLEVAILLCTRNGARFLAEQLRSIADQTHARWSLHVSDDGSRDATLDIIGQFAAQWPGRVVVRSGPRRGACQNFISQIRNRDIEADAFAFADQDDIWHSDKLERALRVVAASPPDRPAVYCGRTRLIAADGALTGYSPLFTEPPSFRNALVQSLAGGNTMMLNAAARDLLAATVDCDPVSHDWWAYQFVSGAGGLVHYDPVPGIDYRQHDHNEIGANQSWAARRRRLGMVLRGEFADWNRRNLNALAANAHLLEPEARALIGDLDRLRAPSLPRRARALARTSLHRQTLGGNLAMVVSVLLGKF